MDRALLIDTSSRLAAQILRRLSMPDSPAFVASHAAFEARLQEHQREEISERVFARIFCELFLLGHQ